MDSVEVVTNEEAGAAAVEDRSGEEGEVGGEVSDERAGTAAGGETVTRWTWGNWNTRRLGRAGGGASRGRRYGSSIATLLSDGNSYGRDGGHGDGGEGSGGDGHGNGGTSV